MPLCVEVNRKFAEHIIKALRSRGLIDGEYLVTRRNEHVVIPIKYTGARQLTIDGISFSLFNCTPPSKRRVSVKLPSHDIVGDVVIIRENALRGWDVDELIESFRSVYPRLKAIWIKEYTVDEYRKPLLRLLWGEEKREIITKEHGLIFKVKLGDVYYNPRLAEEHHRVANLIKDGEVVVDLFAGIGGFSIHIASQRFTLTIANDLNPTAYKLLLENIELNKKRLKGFITPLNMHAREVPSVLRESSADRIIADLPLRGVEFVDVYDALLRPGGVLHLYRLSRDEGVLREELAKIFRGWELKGLKLVIEYAPGAGIYRCDLVKTHNS
jgi:tRNA (guanine37-N1)-methyltransferase